MAKTFRAKTPLDFDDDPEWKKESDRKKWYKPNKKYKQWKKQRRKAKEKSALIKDPDMIPDFPNTDTYDWN